MDYPQFRKYKNGKSYFEIMGENEFLEYKLGPNGIEKHHIEARILPDRNFVKDMLYDYEEHWEEVEKEELEAFLEEHGE